MFSILLHFLFNENQQCVPGLGWCLHPSQYIIYYIHYIHHIYFYHYIIYILYFICIIYCIPGLGKCLRLSQYIIYYLHYIHHIYLSLYNIYINLFVLWTFRGVPVGKNTLYIVFLAWASVFVCRNLSTVEQSHAPRHYMDPAGKDNKIKRKKIKW